MLRSEAYILFYSRKLAVEHLEHSRRILEQVRVFQKARGDGEAVRKQENEDEVTCKDP